MKVRGVTQSRRFRGLAKLSPGCSSCPGDTERGSRCHPLSALARTVVRARREATHAPIATESPVAGVQARLTWWESLARAGAPSHAERGGQVCSEKSEHRKIPRRRTMGKIGQFCPKIVELLTGTTADNGTWWKLKVV